MPVGLYEARHRCVMGAWLGLEVCRPPKQLFTTQLCVSRPGWAHHCVALSQLSSLVLLARQKKL
jgi:hypothetical protein